MSEHVAPGVETLLLACVHQDAGRLDDSLFGGVDDRGWDALLALAAAQRVRPSVYQRLVERGLASRVPASVLEALKDATRRTAKRSLRFQADVAALARALATEHIPIAALKGVYLAQETYGNPALREMNDADVLVRPEHLRRTVEVLLAQGYSPFKPFALEDDVSAHHHVTRLMKQGLGVEVHWSLAQPGRPHSIDPSSLWQRAVPVRIGGTSMLALGPEDLLLHLCHHTSYHHEFEFGLRPFCDIATTIRRFRDHIDWRTVERRSLEWKWHRGVSLALRLAKTLVGAAVPEAAFEPADCDAAMADTAIAQVLSDKTALEVSGKVARFDEQGTALAKARYLGRRLFPPRSKIEADRWLSPSSSGLIPAYARRVCNLAGLYGRTTMQLLFADEPSLASMVERKNRLRDWLSEA